MERSIKLRGLTEDDLDAYVKWRNDPEVTKYLARTGMTVKDATKFLNSLGPKTQAYGIEAGGKLVGYGIIEGIDKVNRKCEVGVVIGEKSVWGKGIGRSVARELSRIAFTELGLHRVLAVASADNGASIACFKAAGFREEGRLRDGYFRDGKFIDLVLLSILSTELED